jgi:hypothetical protein
MDRAPVRYTQGEQKNINVQKTKSPQGQGGRGKGGAANYAFPPACLPAGAILEKFDKAESLFVVWERWFIYVCSVLGHSCSRTFCFMVTCVHSVGARSAWFVFAERLRCAESMGCGTVEGGIIHWCRGFALWC